MMALQKGPLLVVNWEGWTVDLLGWPRADMQVCSWVALWAPVLVESSVYPLAAHLANLLDEKLEMM
jgi:hypothetical protein